MNTLLLTVDDWDLCIDSAGNIASSARPYALAQDVASAVRTFLGEVWYDGTLGVPYLQDILGKAPSFAVFQDAIAAAALTVPEVVTATCQITGAGSRDTTGQVLFTDSSGNQQSLTLT